MTDGRSSEAAVEREQRRLESLCERDVSSIVRGEVASQRPRARHERPDVVHVERESEEQREGLVDAIVRRQSCALDTTKERAHLEVDMTRRVEQRPGILDPGREDSALNRA